MQYNRKVYQNPLGTMESLTVEVFTDDIVAFNYYFLRKTRWRYYIRLLLRFFSPLLFLITLVNILRSPVVRADDIFAGILFGLFAMIYSKWFFRYSIVRYSKQRKGALGVSFYEIREEGLYIKDSDTETIKKWDAFESVEETKDYIFIFMSKTQAYIIPERDFKSAAKREDFLIALEKKIKIQTVRSGLFEELLSRLFL